MATIRLVGYLKKIAGFHEKSIELSKPTPIRDIVDFPDYGPDRLVVLVNEKGANMDTVINDQDQVKIFPVIGGG